ncbi:hypothetical protein LTR37_020143 [Vermiconidia calcicola]|uniref:Uncharacterized protein n=1 Tax=Vermiconidia calcicola TaxID=1690605 RepID=A0ACC3MDE3_9PEZI|nr:hypothetical protein LTR37_020143 [Vermiconidia calcicola]
MLTASDGFRSIGEAQKAIRGGKTTVKAIVEQCLRNIEELDPKLNALTAINKQAVEDAEKLDRLDSAQRGPLFGIPVLVKDQIEIAGIATAFGSKACKTYIPEKDATLVFKLKNAGAVVLGKTTMPDWAASWFSTSSLSETTKNPYDLTRDPGGSSSGSGAGVAAGLAIAAIGGDTGGSIRLPSSFCGLVGVRVTPGRISRNGMSALVQPQDTPGPMAHTVEDAARILDVIVGSDESDPETSVNAIAPLGKSATPFQDAIAQPSLEGRRFGVLRQAFGSDEGVLRVLDSTLKTLEDSGATLVDVQIPDLEHYKTYTSLYVTRSKSDINDFLAARSELAHLKIEELHASGQTHKALDLINAFVKGPSSYMHDTHYARQLTEQTKFQRIVASIYAKSVLDAIIYPTCQLLAPKTADILNYRHTCLGYRTNTVIGSQLLFPAASVPVGMAKDHEHPDDPELPVGLEILGLPLREESLMAVAAGVEAACRRM